MLLLRIIVDKYYCHTLGTNFDDHFHTSNSRLWWQLRPSTLTTTFTSPTLIFNDNSSVNSNQFRTPTISPVETQMVTFTWPDKFWTLRNHLHTTDSNNQLQQPITSSRIHLPMTYPTTIFILLISTTNFWFQQPSSHDQQWRPNLISIICEHVN